MCLRGKTRLCQNKLTDKLTIQSSLNESCSGRRLSLFVLFISYATYWWANTPPWCNKRPLLWGNGFAVCRRPQQLCRVFFSSFSWLPVASLSLFSFAFHTQAIKSVSQCCDPLQHSLFLFFLFSCSSAFLPLSLSFLRVFSVGEEVEAGGGRERRRKSRGVGRGYICSFMTNHMCFWVFVFTCFSWKRGWWKGMTGEERQAYGSCLLS